MCPELGKLEPAAEMEKTRGCEWGLLRELYNNVTTLPFIALDASANTLFLKALWVSYRSYWGLLHQIKITLINLFERFPSLPWAKS